MPARHTAAGAPAIESERERLWLTALRLYFACLHLPPCPALRPRRLFAVGYAARRLSCVQQVDRLVNNPPLPHGLLPAPAAWLAQLDHTFTCSGCGEECSGNKVRPLCVNDSQSQVKKISRGLEMGLLLMQLCHSGASTCCCCCYLSETGPGLAAAVSMLLTAICCTLLFVFCLCDVAGPGHAVFAVLHSCLRYTLLLTLQRHQGVFWQQQIDTRGE
jgi:hypothetical protein